MEQNKANVPKIRFPGFTGEWERRKAGDIFFAVSDKNHPKLPVLSASQEFGMIKRDESGINISHNKENESGYKRVLPGQFVIHLRSFQGGFAHSNIEGITSPAYTVMDFVDKSNYYDCFWKYIFNSEVFIKRLELITYGIRDGRSISYNDFATLYFNFPEYQEQNKIGLFFENIEKLIALQQRKLNHLQAKKKGLLQKMFPKDGEAVPELRFPGFTDAWERRKFKEIFEISQGLQIAISERFLEPGSKRFFYITNEFLKSNCEEKYYIYNPNKNVICDREDVLMTRTGNTGIVVTNVEGCFHNNFFKIKYDKQNFDKCFICQILSSSKMRKRILNSAGNSTIPDLSHKSFYELDEIFPEVKEQRKIGAFFTVFDNLIALHQRKLTHLQEQKKALLQQMFV